MGKGRCHFCLSKVAKRIVPAFSAIALFSCTSLHLLIGAGVLVRPGTKGSIGDFEDKAAGSGGTCA